MSSCARESDCELTLIEPLVRAGCLVFWLPIQPLVGLLATVYEA